MSKRFITTNIDSTISVIDCGEAGPNSRALVKTLFELSRTTDVTTHFDPELHTLEAIATGIEGHRPLVVTAECENTDLPSDRYFRDAWEWED